MTPENELFLFGTTRKLLKFKIVGFLSSPQFQKCRYLVERLRKSYPKDYDAPEIRGMLNVDWDEYLTKMRRKYGKAYYLLDSPVAVYLDGELMGDDKSLDKYVEGKFRLRININFEEVAEEETIKYFSGIIEKRKRKLAYLTISIDEHIAGSMLFLLYNDLVPVTCDNFLTRCKDHCHQHGYKGTRIHRIAKYSWVQCGGFDLSSFPMPCENYSVPHDRRGVLSMCNKRIHEDNSTQFFITLGAAPWMDYNYVAFGQLIQGAEILKKIEKIPTHYENPTHKIEITDCGEFSLCPVPDEDYTTAVNPPYRELFQSESKDEVDSVLSETGYKAGKYFLRTDIRAYLPFTRYSMMFIDKYLKTVHEDLEVMVELKEMMEEVNQKKEVNMQVIKEVKPKVTHSAPFYLKSDISLQ